MIIFGWGRGRAKDKGPAAPLTCPNCHNTSHYRYVSATRWFSLFFIPIIPYNTKHLLLCPVCTQGLELRRDQVPVVEEMVQWTERYARGEVGEADYRARTDHLLDALTAGPGRDVTPPLGPGWGHQQEPPGGATGTTF